MSETLDIQEYRIKSSEALGLKIKTHGKKETIVMLDDWYAEWCPDTDANQREMVEDFLIKDRICWINYIHYFESTECEIGPIPNKVQPEFENSINTKDKSKSIAFMKAFLEYEKTIRAKSESYENSK